MCGKSGGKKHGGLFAKFSSYPLVKKIRYLFLFVICVYLAFFGLVYVFFIRNNLSDYAEKKNLNTLSAISGNLTSEADRVSDMSILIMTDEAVISYLKSDAGNYTKVAKESVNTLYDLMNVFEGISSIYIFDNNLNYVSASRSVTTVFPRKLLTSAWSQDMIDNAGGYIITVNKAILGENGNPVSGDYMFRTKLNEPLITFVRVINDLGTQKPIGYLAVNLPLTILGDTYEDHVEGDSRFGYLYYDQYIYGDDLTAEFNLIPDHSASHKQKIVGTWGNERIISYYRLPGSPLTLVSSERFYAGQVIPTETALIIAMMIVITLASMLLISAFISFYITKPIKGLVHSMDAVARTGGLQKSKLFLPDDEIGHLKNRYNSMLDEIDALFKELIVKEKRIRNDEFRALQEQIKPHFLYNTLDTLAFMASEDGADDVYEALQTLSNFFTNFLSNGSSEIPLRTEVEVVKDYLKLQKYRYGDIFDDEYVLQDDLLDFKVPKLILQPLVENSLYHGVRLKGEKCVIRISIFEKDKVLHLVVYDSGVGMSKDRIKGILKADRNDDSFGLKGTIERIRYFCDRDDVFEIRSEEGLFTEVDISIPLDGKK